MRHQRTSKLANVIFFSHAKMSENQELTTPETASSWWSWLKWKPTSQILLELAENQMLQGMC